MSDNWPYNIKHVTPGEPVQAGIVSRPDHALQDRTDYLKERLDAAELGQAIFDSNATIAPDVQPGHAVFWNYTARRYEKARAAVEVDETSQAYVVQPSSDCVGLCFRKQSETLGDIVLHGIVSIPNLQNAIVGTLQPGRYYLSAAEPGKLVKQRPAVTVSVCYVQGQEDTCNPVPRVVVMPNTRELIDEHTHYRFELFAKPAGNNTVIAVGDLQRHTITNADSDLQGWLPANHSIFNGKAPAGAAFGYNLSAHPALSNVWPPLPLQAATVLVDRGQNLMGATEVPLGPTGLVICDAHGIWWMSNCYGDAPWPATYTTEEPVIETGDCPRNEEMRIVVVFIRMLIGNDRNLVTSLIPGDDSPVVITKCSNGQNATPASPGTGDLALNLNLQYANVNDMREEGEDINDEGLIVTGKTASGRRLQRGYVAAGVIAHNLPQNLSIVSTNERNLTAEEKELLELPLADTVKLHRGILKLNFDRLAEKEIAPQIIRLNDTVERLYMDIPYLGFPAGQASSMRIRLNVPDADLGSNLRMAIRVQFFGKGTAVQQIPALVMTYRRIIKPGSTVSTALSLPQESEEAALSFDTAVSLPANKAIVRSSETFSVLSGDTVLVTIARTAGDSYPEVGVLRISGILSNAATPV